MYILSRFQQKFLKKENILWENLTGKYECTNYIQSYIIKVDWKSVRELELFYFFDLRIILVGLIFEFCYRK